MAKKSKWRVWTEDDIEYLKSNAGELPIERIAKRLKRTEWAVRRKCDREKIPIVANATFLQLSDVARIVGVNNKTVWYWTTKYGLNHERIKLNHAERPFVDFDVLIKWLRENQDRWNTDNMETYALNAEYDWLKEKRRKDMARKDKNRNKVWTDNECERIISMLAQNKSWEEIGHELQRPPNHKTIRAALYRYYKQKGVTKNGRRDSRTTTSVITETSRTGTEALQAGV